MKYRRVLFSSVALFLMLGCASVKVTRYNDRLYPPTTKVEVFKLNKPSKEFVEIAELMVRDRGEGILALIEEAKNIGADALILNEPKSKNVIAPYGNSVIGTTHWYLSATAIKYK